MKLESNKSPTEMTLIRVKCHNSCCLEKWKDRASTILQNCQNCFIRCKIGCSTNFEFWSLFKKLFFKMLNRFLSNSNNFSTKKLLWCKTQSFFPPAKWILWKFKSTKNWNFDSTKLWRYYSKFGKYEQQRFSQQTSSQINHF